MTEGESLISIYVHGVKSTYIDRFTHGDDVIDREASVLLYLCDKYLACCGLERSWRG
jgi:hypothetical protein